MEQHLAYTIERISENDPRAGAKLQTFVEGAGATFQFRAERFLSRFEQFIESKGKTFDYGIECYLKLRAAMAWENLNFLRNGCYSNSSFAEVAERVYRNPEVMEYHMYGLVFAQFLWPDQYLRFSFFCDNFAKYIPNIRNYLEIGAGHALYVSEAAAVLSPEAHIDVVDISPSSMELAEGMLNGAKVSTHLIDIFDFAPGRRYDFITIGEVLEHLEDPLAMLNRIRELLSPRGWAYITTPANSPMIDHIYLFNNAHEIREMLHAGGFNVENEAWMYANDLPPAKAEKQKVALMYAAFVRPV
jgi:2-polyprenyl-3-methyl-5-hydroxy-6-metoxy-1,4-benzoquinol methylase